MRLKKFIKEFSHNNMIRLHYQTDDGYKCVLENFNEVSMDWEILKGKGPNRHFIDNEVMKILGIYVQGHYPDAINIVIEELTNQPFIEEFVEESTGYECGTNL